MRQGPLYRMPAKIEGGKLIINIPLEVIAEFDDREVKAIWRDDEANMQITILIDT